MNRFAIETTADGQLLLTRYGMVLSRAEALSLAEDLVRWLDVGPPRVDLVEALAEPAPERIAGRAEGSAF